MSKESASVVMFRVQPENPPKLSPQEQAAWDTLKKVRDPEADLGEICGQPKRHRWHSLQRMEAADSEVITLRLDADVLEFFRSSGYSYHKRINAALREYMDDHTSSC